MIKILDIYQLVHSSITIQTVSNKGIDWSQHLVRVSGVEAMGFISIPVRTVERKPCQKLTYINSALYSPFDK